MEFDEEEEEEMEMKVQIYQVSDKFLFYESQGGVISIENVVLIYLLYFYFNI